MTHDSVSLKEYIDEKFQDAEKMFNLVRELSERSNDKAENAQAAINVAQNEWRATFQEYTKLTVLRPEFEKLDQSLSALRLEIATKLSSDSGSKSGAREIKEDSKSIVALIISVLTFVIMLGFGVMNFVK